MSFVNCEIYREIGIKILETEEYISFVRCEIYIVNREGYKNV